MNAAPAKKRKRRPGQDGAFKLKFTNSSINSKARQPALARSEAAKKAAQDWLAPWQPT
jgi:hypothetical protein